MSSLSLRARHDNGRAVLTIVGELDLATVPSLREAGISALSEPGCRALLLDLAGLTFLDSTGLGCWIELRNRAEESGQDFALHAHRGTRNGMTVTIHHPAANDVLGQAKTAGAAYPEEAGCAVEQAAA